MAEVLDQDYADAEASLLIHPLASLKMDDDQFFEFCQRNPQVRIERTSKGDLIIMTPAGAESSSGNFELVALFAPWVRENGEGRAFDSSCGFRLPNKAVRAPDVSWVRKERLRRVTPEQWKKFLPLCPDFALELRSPSDSLSTLREKMQEYIDNGAQLGWLIDPAKKTVYVYRPRKKPEILTNSRFISGDPVLPGFKLDLREVWKALLPEY